MKQIQFSDEARQSLIRGVNILAKAVVTTLGPKGRNVAIDKKWGAPNVIHDGVTVAKEIELADPFENMGAQLVKEAASKTNDVAGDGTTTATLLTQSIVNEAQKYITSGTNPMMINKGLEKGRDVLLKEITLLSKKIKSGDSKKIASISAQNESLGLLVSEGMEKIGNDGFITVEEGSGRESFIEYKEGMEFDKGYASAYFITNQEKMIAEIINPYILITDKKISSVSELVPFLEGFVKVSKNLVIIADDIDGEALAMLVVNKLKGTLNVLAIKAPEFGDRRKDALEDLALLAGATIISESMGRNLDSITIEDCGRSDKVWSDKETTKVIGGKGKKTDIIKQVLKIKKQVEKASSDFDKEKLQVRLSKLSGGVAIIHVGAETEVELKEKKERVIDAVSATKAAIESGIVSGGGTTLLWVRKHLKSLVVEGDEKLGVDILYKALESPIYWIVNNAGGDAGFVIREVEKGNKGFDVMDMSFKDMIVSGIIDPTKVVTSAVKNAVSVSMMILSTDVLITDLPEKEKHEPLH